MLFVARRNCSSENGEKLWRRRCCAVIGKINLKQFDQRKSNRKGFVNDFISKLTDHFRFMLSMTTNAFPLFMIFHPFQCFSSHFCKYFINAFLSCSTFFIQNDANLQRGLLRWSWFEEPEKAGTLKDSIILGCNRFPLKPSDVNIYTSLSWQGDTQ